MLNETFDELQLEKHPDKTAMGKTEKGFDFLGFHFSPEGLSVAEKTIENFIARAIRLYEQERRGPSGSPLLGLYVRRWLHWVGAFCIRGRHIRSPGSASRRRAMARVIGVLGGVGFPAAVHCAHAPRGRASPPRDDLI